MQESFFQFSRFVPSSLKDTKLFIIYSCGVESVLSVHSLPHIVLSSVTTQTGLGGGYGPGGTWGLVELVAVIAGPLFLLCLLLLVGVFLYQYHQRAYSHRQRLEVEDPSCDHLYLAKDRTLQDLIYDLSTSGSGSG